MKAIVQKIILFLRYLFFHLRVAVELRIGRKEVRKDDNENLDNEESRKGDYL